MAKKSAINKTMSPFFRPAREIRDQIYEECLVDFQGDQGGYLDFLRYRVERTTEPDLLLVSRQFSMEYEERAKALGYCTLVANSRRRPQYNARFLSSPFAAGISTYEIPQRFARIRSFQIDLTFVYTEGLPKSYRNLNKHETWLSKYIGLLPALQSLEIRVVVAMKIWYGNLTPEALATGIHELNRNYWLGLKHLKQLEVYVVPGGSGSLEDLSEFGPQHTLFAKLSKDTGKVEAIKDLASVSDRLATN